MKQYRITSENFVLQGETGDADAVMDSKDLHELKKLAGITGLLEAEGGMYTGQNTTPQAGEDGIQSPVGSNISKTAEDRRELEREYNAKPGTDLWFIINFTKPYLNGSVRSKVEEYLKQHPEYRQRPNPGG
jgi:hypothetical protein